LQDVVANQGAVPLIDALVEAVFESFYIHRLLRLSHHTDFPQGLQAVAGGDKTLVFGHGQQRFKVFQNSLLRITFGEIGKHLRRNRPDVVIFVL
jgi:hypothetical protein